MGNMTYDDKLSMLHGVPLFKNSTWGDRPHSASVIPIERLNLPRINVNDGP